MKFLTKYMRHIILWVPGGVFVLVCTIVALTFSTIYHQVEQITTLAMNEYGSDPIESLESLIESGHHSFEEKNSAVWALGQLADPAALPFLTTLYSETENHKPCYRNQAICAYEIEKAIKWCEQGNLTSWMYKKYTY